LKGVESRLATVVELPLVLEPPAGGILLNRPGYSIVILLRADAGGIAVVVVEDDEVVTFLDDLRPEVGDGAG
jgi:hypothetical protein